MPKLYFCSSWNIHLLRCSKPSFAGTGVSGQKCAQARGSSTRSLRWSWRLRRSSAWGPTWLCHAQETSCSRATFLLLTLALYMVGGFMFMGLSPPAPVTERLWMGQEQPAGPRALHPHTSSCCMLAVWNSISYTSYLSSILSLPQQLFTDRSITQARGPGSS